jgi:hypothetical protein
MRPQVPLNPLSPHVAAGLSLNQLNDRVPRSLRWGALYWRPSGSTSEALYQIVHLKSIGS